MPSKKKSSKTPSKSSSKSDPNSDDVSSVSNSVPYNDEQLLLSCLDEASAKFPSLIARTALIGKIANDAVLDSKNRRIWLSESVMVGSSIAPGSLVSVSLASFDKGGGFALSVLSDECGSQFGFDLVQNLADQAGNYFSLATVFPSSKVLKDGVRLSSNVSHTLGCPASGRTVFVYPVKCQRLIENGNGKQSGSETSCFSLNSCRDLYLRPIYVKGKSKTETAISSHLNLSNKSTDGHVENSKISSPRTPSRPESRVSSPCSSQSRTSNYFTSALKSSYSSHASTDILDIKEVLEDDSSRKLIETCTTSWLCSQSLLPGNIVIVPILSSLLVFQFIGSEGLLLNSEVGNGKNHDFPTRAPDLGEDMATAFSIDWGTKIHFLVPGNNVVETSVELSSAHPESGLRYNEDSTRVNFGKLGGLSKEFAVLKDIVISSAVNVKLASLGLRPTKGVLLHGPPGTGKTTLARLCARDAGVNLFPVNGPEIISLYHGETEQALHEVFDKASQAAPAVVFIDELDAIAPARKEGGDDLSQRMVATLLNLMDGISRTDGILIIAATNRPDSIEPALRRPGRLDREIEIGVPSPGQRLEILHTLLREMEHSLCDRDIQHLSMVTHGFVGADLAALCNEAALVRLRQYVNLSTSHDYPDSTFSTVAFDSVCQTSSLSPDLCSVDELDASESRGDSMNGNLEAAFYRASETKNSSDFMDETGENANCIVKNTLRVTPEDFEKARIRIRPSAMREVILEVPKVGWEDVGGQTEIKMQLMEAVEWPQKHSEAFKRLGTRPPSGILLFGPPGCSKTLLARAVASEAGLNFLAVKGPELFSKWVGESEKAVRSLFAKARANAPSIIFFDEIDGLAITRGKESDGVSVGDRVISQLLVELDGLQERGSVTVIAATNRPDKIDAALLRPGRFDRLLYVGPPSKKDREDIFRVHLQRMPCSSDVCISELSLLTEGCTGADISLICREAAIAAMEENLSASEITMDHLKVGIHNVQPSDVQMFEKLSTKFQRLVHSTADKDDLGYEPCSSERSHIPLWRRIKSGAHSLLRRGS